MHDPWDDPSSLIGSAVGRIKGADPQRRMQRARRARKGRPPIQVSALMVLNKAVELRDRRQFLATCAVEVLLKVSFVEAKRYLMGDLQSAIRRLQEVRGHNMTPMFLSLMNEVKGHPGTRRGLERFVLTAASN